MKQISLGISEFTKNLMLVNSNALSIPLADESYFGERNKE